MICIYYSYLTDYLDSEIQMVITSSRQITIPTNVTSFINLSEQGIHKQCRSILALGKSLPTTNVILFYKFE